MSDDTGAVDVVYWRNTAAKLPPSLQEPKPGLRVEAKGSVDEYPGNVQLRVTTTVDIRELVADEDQRSEARPARAGGGQRSDRPAAAGATPPPSPPVEDPARGSSAAKIPSTGKAGVANPFDVGARHAVPAAPPSATVAPTPSIGERSEVGAQVGAQHAVPVRPIALSSITQQMKGKQVVVEGTVRNVIKVREDDLLLLDDGTTKVYVPIWEWVKKLLPAEKQPQLGNTVCVRGLVHFPKDYDYAMIVITSAEDVIRVRK
jgi:hypothetical protein